MRRTYHSSSSSSVISSPLAFATYPISSVLLPQIFLVSFAPLTCVDVARIHLSLSIPGASLGKLGEKVKLTSLSVCISPSTPLNRPTAPSLNSSNRSTFAYSPSTNFAKTRIRAVESDGRLVKSEARMPRRCSSSSRVEEA